MLSLGFYAVALSLCALLLSQPNAVRAGYLWAAGLFICGAALIGYSFTADAPALPDWVRGVFVVSAAISIGASWLIRRRNMARATTAGHPALRVAA